MQIAMVLVLGSAFALTQTSEGLKSASPTGIVEGTVFSYEGAPVADAMVYAVPERSSGGLKFPRRTDEIGRFRLDDVRAGRSVLYAYKLEDGYLDPSFAFNSGNRPSAITTVVAGSIVSVKVTLGPKCAYLVGTVKDSERGEPVSSASFRVNRADDTKIWLSTVPVDAAGHFRLGVPSETPIQLNIVAEHFRAWKMDADSLHTAGDALILKPGQEYPIDVRLQAVTTNR
jgi:hypothetical protein